ncbi:MAG TPA: homocysteine S-methyltransferase family protein, partial [Candidatus Obscuribacterales bacterium]
MTRDRLPQCADQYFLTDGGLETTLIFHEGIQLPHFAAIDLLKNAFGCEVLRKYFQTYARLAQTYRAGCVLESATWRASLDWGDKLGYSPQALADLNRRAIALLRDIRSEFETPTTPVVISGCLGPRGDGYVPDQPMTAAA